MGNVLLCGVTHARRSSQESLNGSLVRSEEGVQERFYATVNAFLTENSLLLLEGFHEELVRGTLRYDRLVRGAGIDLARLCRVPDVWGIDIRFTLAGDSRKEKQLPTHVSRAFAAGVYLRPVGCASPDSLEEMVALAKEGLSYDASGLPARLRHSLAVLRRSVREFDEHVIKTIRGCASRYDSVILVAGAAHALSIHAQTGWELGYCIPDVPEWAHTLFHTYLPLYGRPQKERQAARARA